MSPATSQAFQGLVFALGVSIGSYRFRLLTAGGAVSQFVVGWIVLGIGGWACTVPMLAFFVTSSALSKLMARRPRTIEVELTQNPIRGALQVLANGGIASAIVVWNALAPHHLLYPAYVGCLTAATADSWGTEIGVRFGRRPRLLSSLAPVAAGRSGAITFVGTMGGFLGATVVALSSAPWVTDGAVVSLGACIVAGVLGSMADSLAGATLQARYRCAVCGSMTDSTVHCSAISNLAGGMQWMTNDSVNLICTMAGGLSAVAITSIIG